MTDKHDERLSFLIEETSEDAVFCMLTAISVFGIESIDDALTVIENDDDCEKWLDSTVRLIVGPWSK